MQRLSFYEVTNERNRELLQEYMKYQVGIKSIDYTEEHYGKTKYIFVKKEDPLRPFQYSMLQHRVMQMIRKNDIRDENGELLNFGTHTFRHCYGKKLTEMHIDDWMIARLLGHKTLQSVHHYSKSAVYFKKRWTH